MGLWRGTIEYTPVLTGKRVWQIIEVEATTREQATEKAILKAGIGPIRRQLTQVKVDIGSVSSQYSGVTQSPVKKKFEVVYLDSAGRKHTEQIEDDVTFYQRVRREGLSVISIHEITSHHSSSVNLEPNQEKRRCGEELAEWLRDKGLSLSDVGNIISRIPNFLSTTFAFDEHGMIVDYDQYYEMADTVRSLHGRAIWQRLRKIGAVDRVLIFNNVGPNCLEYYGTISPYI